VKLRVGIIIGGQSSEHEVSVISGKCIIEAMDREKYTPVPIGIDFDGRWRLLSFPLTCDRIDAGEIIEGNLKELIDVAFPALHGPFGEDGTVQGHLVCLGIPFVGSGVLGSAIGMDKDVSKRLLRDANIPQVPFVTLYRGEEHDLRPILRSMQFPLFVKPANLGSSVGISKVDRKGDLQSAIDEAFLYDRKVVIEKGIVAREFEVSILGGERPFASLPGEVISKHEFYSYEAKRDDFGEELVFPAQINADTTSEIQDLALRTYKVLNLSGMARIDFFMDTEGKIYLNEVNTIPGFTPTSLFPKLWSISGISYPMLIESLIGLALEDRESPKSRGELFLRSQVSQ
jgi:D-alanine-D-alanine ligase